jgi:hypothetical protein
MQGMCNKMLLLAKTFDNARLDLKTSNQRHGHIRRLATPWNHVFGRT